MYPDGLIPLQGSGLSASGLSTRPPRILLLSLIGMLGALVALLFFAWFPSTCRAPGRDAGSEIIMLCRSGRPDIAVTVANRALSESQDCPIHAGWIHYLRGGALRLLGQDDLARADYNAAASLMAPENTDQAQLDLESEAGNWPVASNLANNILNNNDSDPYAINDACWNLAMYPGGDPAVAVERMSAIAEKTNDPGLVDTYAWSLYRGGDVQDAIQQETRACRLAESEDTCHRAYYGACLTGMQGRQSQAIDELRAIFADDITFTSAWVAADSFAQQPVEARACPYSPATFCPSSNVTIIYETAGYSAARR